MSTRLTGGAHGARTATDSDRLKRLERVYRLLLFAYPENYRRTKGDEIVATLLDNAHPRQTVPSAADIGDVLGHALRRRVSGELEEAGRTAAPWALALAAGLAAYLWWRVEPVVPTTGPIAYVAWILAATGVVLLPGAVRRPLVGMALAATLSTVLLAPLLGVNRPPIWILMSLLGLGSIAAAAGRGGPTVEQRLNIAATATAFALACRLLTPTVSGYYQPVIARIGAAFAFGLVATAVVAVYRILKGDSPRRVLLAGLVLALPATWLGPIDWIAWEFPVDDLTAARFGRLTHVIVATCAVVSLLAVVDRTRPVRNTTVAGALTGSALGYAVFAAMVDWPAHATSTLIALGATALFLRARPGVRATAVTAALTLLACWLVGIYSNNWTATGWESPARTVVLASMLTLVPCSLAALIGVKRRSAAIVPSGLWIGYLILPALLAWGPLLWALAIAATAGAIRQALSRRGSQNVWRA